VAVSDWDPHDSEHNPYWWEREEAQAAADAADAGWEERPSDAELAADAEEYRRRKEEDRRQHEREQDRRRREGW
jgi:hypothetical protein